MKKLLTLLLSALALVTLALGLGACSKKASTSASSGNLKIVATTDFYGQVAKEVLGKYGTVTSIIKNPSVDPHEYSPTTKVAKVVANSDLVLYNGLEYDTWVKKLGGSKYLSVASITKQKIGANEHLWYKKNTMAKVAQALATEYGKLDSKHKKQFEANAKKYQAKLATLNTMLAKIKKNSDGKKVAVSEPVFDYALQAMGYTVINNHFAKATEDGTDPSYSDIKDLQTAIKNHEIAFFVENIQTDSKTVNNIVNLCKENNVPVVKVTETLPSGKNYIQWMTSEYKQVLKIQNS